MTKNEATTVTTAEEAPTAETPAKRRGVQVAATVPAEYFDGLTDHKWTARMTIQEIVRAALDAYVADNGIAVDGTAPQVNGKK